MHLLVSSEITVSRSFKAAFLCAGVTVRFSSRLSYMTSVLILQPATDYDHARFGCITYEFIL